jgi:sensor histidine kinase regulating citrate/malate metabolism
MLYEIVSLIRDIAIIVMAVMVVVLSLTLTIMLAKIYPSLRRGSQNFAMASDLMLNTASRITSIVNMSGELAGIVWRLVERLRNRGSRDAEDGTSASGSEHQ